MRQIRTLAADIFFVLLIIVLVLVSFLSYQRIGVSKAAYNLANHTSLVRLKLEQIMVSVSDAETAQHGFLLTQDSVFLRPYLGAELRTTRLTDELDSLVKDNRSQQANALSLRRLIALRYERLRFNLAASGQPLEKTYPFLVDGNRFMIQIRFKIAEMTLIEEHLLQARVAENNRYAGITPLYTLLFSIFAITVVAFAYYRLRRETRLRFRAEDGEAIIHKFFMQVPAMIAILKGPEHQFEFANPAYHELLRKKDLVGKKVRDALPEVSGQGYFEILDRVYQTRETYIGKEMPLQIDKGDGQSVSAHINFTYQAIVSLQNKTEGILVFCYDVTEMVANRNRIEETEQRLRLAIEAAEIGTFDWDFVKNRFLSSLRLTEIFGFDDAVNTTHHDLIARFHPEDKAIRDKAVESSHKKGSLVYEARIIWPDQSVHWVNVYGKVIYNEERVPLRMYGTALDITSQKNILEEIRESETRFRVLANSMPQQIWTCDEKGIFNYFNDAIFNFTGLSSAQLVELGWIPVLHPDDRERHNLKWTHALETGGEFVIEHRFLNYRGEYRWQLSRAIPQRDSAGKIQRWVGTSTDIQDQRDFMLKLEKLVAERTLSLQQANEHLEKTVDELERINGELESFNYIASHDLQEPLRKIIAFSQRINDKEKENLSEISKDYFSRITAAAARMQSLIDAFLSYSQNTNNHSKLEEVDLNQTLEEVRFDLSNVIDEKKVIITAENLPEVCVIRIQFHQLFVNLISNAVKYSKPDTTPVIKIIASKIFGKDTGIPEAGPDELYHKISFTDNGIGFDQEYVHKIFQLFQRLHAKSEYTGTGIGLAICKKIIENHKGFITAHGEAGVGAVFILYFPVT